MASTKFSPNPPRVSRQDSFQPPAAFASFASAPNAAPNGTPSQRMVASFALNLFPRGFGIDARTLVLEPGPLTHSPHSTPASSSLGRPPSAAGTYSPHLLTLLTYLLSCKLCCTPETEGKREWVAQEGIRAACCRRTWTLRRTPRPGRARCTLRPQQRGLPPLRGQRGHPRGPAGQHPLCLLRRQDRLRSAGLSPPAGGVPQGTPGTEEERVSPLSTSTSTSTSNSSSSSTRGGPSQWFSKDTASAPGACRDPGEGYRGEGGKRRGSARTTAMARKPRGWQGGGKGGGGRRRRRRRRRRRA